VKGSIDKTIRLWNLESGLCTSRLELGLELQCEIAVLTTLSDGTLISGNDDGFAWLWNLKDSTGHRIGLPPDGASEPWLDHTRAVISIQEVDATRVLTAAWDGLIKLWHRCAPTAQDPNGAWWTVATQLMGKYPCMISDVHLVCASYADMDMFHSLWLWDLDPKDPEETAVPSWQQAEDVKLPPKHQRTMKGHTAAVFGLAQLDKGQLISWSEDRTIRLWSTRTIDNNGTRCLACKLIFNEHTDAVSCVRQLQHGKYKGALLSISWDKTLRLWPNPRYHT